MACAESGLCTLLPINIPGRCTNWETSDKYAFEDTYGLVIHLILDTRASRFEINLFYQWSLLVCAEVLRFCQGKRGGDKCPLWSGLELSS